MVTDTCTSHFFVLFELILNVSVNSYGNVETLPLFYPTLGCHDTQMCLINKTPKLTKNAYYVWMA